GPAPTTSASVSIGAADAAGESSATGAAASPSLDQLVELAGAVFPLVRIGERRLAPGDARPVLRQLGIERDHVLLVARHVLLGDDRVHRALGDADRAVDALVG